MTINADIQTLAPGDLVVLFELDATNLGGQLFRFHAGTNGLRSAVYWRGNQYVPMPIEAAGFEANGKGQIARPTIKVANLGGAIYALTASFDDLLGAKLTRRRTLGKYLDAVNFPGGVNPTADSLAEFPQDIYFVDRKANENNVYTEWELSASFDVAGVQLPRRPMTQTVCLWTYRVNDGVTSACSYAGTTYFDANDVSVATVAQDACGRKLSSCRARFQGAALPFGGFPGVGLSKS